MPCNSHYDIKPLSNSCTGGHTDFIFAPEDEDIFFSVSDGSDAGSTDAAFESTCNDADVMPDVVQSAVSRCL